MKTQKLILILILILLPFFAFSQSVVKVSNNMQKSVRTIPQELDVFTPISKYLSQGDVEKLSAWFSDNIEITIISESNTCSRIQAKQILKSFFSTNKAREFKISHKVSQSNVKYAMGRLSAGGKLYLVTIFLTLKGDNYQIQQFKIENIS